MAGMSIHDRRKLTPAAERFVSYFKYDQGHEIVILAVLIAFDEGRTRITIGDMLQAFASWNNGVTRLASWGELVSYAEAEREDFGGISVGGG